MAVNFLVKNNFLFEPTLSSQQVVVRGAYETRGVFSINASNELQATFWVIKDGEQLLVDLGDLSFNIKDKNGVDIGISQSLIAPDANGFYHSLPVSASSIQDLTHYTVQIFVEAEDQSLKGVIAITLGE